MASNDVVLNVVTKTENALKQLSQFSQQSNKILKDIDKNLSFLNQSVTTFTGNLAAGLALKGFDAITNGIKSIADAIITDGITAAIAYEDSLNQLTISFEQAGIASVESISKFEEFANQLEETTKFSDDQILTNAALIQSLSRLSEEGLERATIAATNLAAATGRDLVTASEAVAKAANGNVTSLQRLGIEIKKGATDAETFANTLAVLETRFGGAATNQLLTFSGATTQLNNAFEDTVKAIGNLVIRSPALVGAISGITKIFQGLTKFLESSFQGQDPLRPLVEGTINFARAVNDLVIAPLIRVGEIGNFVFQGIKNLIAQTLTAFAQFGIGIDEFLNKIGVISDETLRESTKTATFLSEAANQASDDFAEAFGDIGSNKFSENIDKQLNVISESVKNTTKIGRDEFRNFSNVASEELAKISDKSIEIGIKIGDPEAIKEALNQSNQAVLDAQAQLNLTQDEVALAREQAEIEGINRITQIQLEAIAARTTAISGNNFELLALQQQALQQQLNNENLTAQQRAVIQKKITDNERQQLALRLNTASTFFGDLSSLSQTKNKELFAIGKAAALANAVVQGALAVQNALAVQPFPVGLALATAAAVKAAVNIATISAQSLASGTDFVTGGVPGKDSVPALLMPGERVLSVPQNKDLTNFLDQEQSSGSDLSPVTDILSSIFDRLGSLENTIVVNVGNREIVREVREGLRAGRTLEI